MSLTECLFFNDLLIQYVLIFVSIISIAKLSYVGCVLSNIGLILVVSYISWYLTKKFNKCDNTENSFKRAVLITGCDTGFGNATAHKLNENGFRVYATVLNPDCNGAKDLVTGAYFEGKTKVMRMDVTNEEEIKSVYDEIKRDLQQNGEELWAVVNNAGILTLGPIDWGTTEAFKTMIEVNTLGTVRVTRTFLPLIRKSKGRIVNLVSMAGRITPTNEGHYSMSKHAIIAFSDALRRENKNYGVEVSTVEPIAYKTPMAIDDNIILLLDKQWNESAQEVKDFYGQDFYKNLRENREKGTGNFPPSENIHEVVDKLVEAVRSSKPDIRYPVIPKIFLARFFFSVFEYIPDELLDELVSSRGILKKAN